MEPNLTTTLFEAIYERDNETRITNGVIGPQDQDPFKDPGEKNLGRLEDYFEFINSKKWAENDGNTTYTN
jgi:hypothetical protein